MQVTVYIRKENEGRWVAIGNKSEWLNKVLSLESLSNEEIGRVIQKRNPGFEVTVTDTPPAPAKPVETPSLCKIHGTPLDARGKCLQKGCKYS